MQQKSKGRGQQSEKRGMAQAHESHQVEDTMEEVISLHFFYLRCGRILQRLWFFCLVGVTTVPGDADPRFLAGGVPASMRQSEQVSGRQNPFE